MLKPVYIVADNIISPLGANTKDNMNAVLAGQSAIKQTKIPAAIPIEVFAAIIPDDIFNNVSSTIKVNNQYTRFEKLAIASIANALSKSNVNAASHDTLFILSTTKGNIDLLKDNAYPDIDSNRIHLSATAKVITEYFNNPNTPLVISNACISGVLAIITGARLIAQGKYKQVVVCGGDIINDFTVSGFQSFKALSNGPCKPFDAHRMGLNLGEAFGTVILSGEKLHDRDIQILGGASSNDANHISGPSRDGGGLKIAVKNALKESGLNHVALGFISAHGTATPYNDEMEAIAFDDLGLGTIPVNSLKGYFGHTLAGAGLVEAIVSAYALQQNILVNTLGYSQHGVSRNIPIINKTTDKEMTACLKTASGFGGCNAALVLSK